MFLQTINLPYKKYAALDYFNNLSHLPWSMLLYSGDAKHLYNRFDILVADPVVTLESKGNTTLVCSKNNQYQSYDDPFNLLKYELEKFKFSVFFNQDLPFQGGAVGIFSYDLVRRIEFLPNNALNELNCPDMACGIYLWALIIDHHKKCITLLSHDNVKKRLLWLNKQSRINMKHFILVNSWKSNMSKSYYYQKFQQIYEHLSNGDCYQVNLAQRFKAKYEGDEWNAFLKLNQINKSPFSAFIKLIKNSIISVSPERFLWLHNHFIQSRPIKGTLPKLNNKLKDLEQINILQLSEKNRAENLMIVDLLRNDIGKVAVPGTVMVPNIFQIESFSAVHHLVSTVTGKLLLKFHPIDLLKFCFPGGSITGAPKIRAMEIIDQVELHRRHSYCGAIGYVSFCGTMDTNINIRSLLTENNFIYCWGGGGIVIDSLVEQEYQEIFDKLNTILPVL